MTDRTAKQVASRGPQGQAQDSGVPLEARRGPLAILFPILLGLVMWALLAVAVYAAW